MQQKAVLDTKAILDRIEKKMVDLDAKAQMAYANEDYETFEKLEDEFWTLAIKHSIINGTLPAPGQ